MSSPLLNIAAISRRTGIAPDTLRKWEARYGVLRPRRTPGGQRRYTEQDIARVEWLRDRLQEGWRIGEAARMLEETSAPPVSDPAALRDALTEAAVSDDPARVGALLDQAFAVLPLEVSLDEVLAPTLRWIGEEWHGGRLTIAQEHAASARVRAKLEQLMADQRGEVRGTAVLACAPGELHDLGLLMLAVALRADGWRVEYLGANTPVEHAVEHAERIGATVLCFSASRPDTATALEHGLAALAVTPSPEIVAGGGGVVANRLGRGVRRSPERITDAVAELRALAA
jgi:DNA-binding transcriptional MerR regulator